MSRPAIFRVTRCLRMAPLFRVTLSLSLILAFGVPSHAQDSRQGGSPYLLPQTVYVGDRASLVLPLQDMGAPSGTGKDPNLSLGPKELPSTPDIELHRVSLERRGGGGRLLIEFSAYAPGTLELPPFEIGGSRYSGLRVEISSIIGSGGEAAVLSGPASPLSIPGTGVLIYGTMAGLALLLLLGLWTGLWGRRHLAGWILKWKRRRLIFFMAGIERRARRSLQKGGGNYPAILNAITSEFRNFLSFFTGENCRAMTSVELARLPPLAKEAAGLSFLSGAFLGGFFRRCDDLRFSGAEILKDELVSILEELKQFLYMLDRAERGKFGELRI